MTTTQIGLVDWRLPVSGPEAVLLAAELGVDGLQVDLGGPGRAPELDEPGRLRGLRSAFGDTGVAPLAVSVNVLNDIGLTAPEGTEGARRVRGVISRALDLAGSVGAGLVFLPSFRRSAIDGAQALARTVEVLRWACDEAGRRELLLANENVLTPDDLRELVRRVDSPSFRVVVDTGNIAVFGLTSAEVIDAAGPLVANQVHVKNADAVKPLALEESPVVDALAELDRAGVTITALVLENDHRDGDLARVAADLDWLRAHVATRSPSGAAA
ncbi:sugar phosphate isomerase/epimerase family protein [Actinokineospora globicatena]|uniref:Xylose isomerase-like TIM barrel domain-containing protein n=1 Tax=Actinokineospora globicatena TaxID=103729 RepID=A0A9W6VAS0_9PSEU|nr:sugar phosphate isomerase/epimerase family protein [Actinokineospora globicatena]GLW93244.1 hypothetical protein Aglo03_40600 [Actinokineospora globicatena]